MPNFEDDSGNCHAPDPNGVACYKSRIGCPIHPRQKRKRHKCSELSALRLDNDRLRAENERLKRDSDEAREESKPVQEPVAWRNKKWGYFTVNPIASKHTDWEPLYTAQRPRQLRNALEGKP